MICNTQNYARLWYVSVIFFISHGILFCIFGKYFVILHITTYYKYEQWYAADAEYTLFIIRLHTIIILVYRYDQLSRRGNAGNWTHAVQVKRLDPAFALPTKPRGWSLDCILDCILMYIILHILQIVLWILHLFSTCRMYRISVLHTVTEIDSWFCFNDVCRYY